VGIAARHLIAERSKRLARLEGVVPRHLAGNTGKVRERERERERERKRERNRVHTPSRVARVLDLDRIKEVLLTSHAVPSERGPTDESQRCALETLFIQAAISFAQAVGVAAACPVSSVWETSEVPLPLCGVLQRAMQ
jgi:hypothetical protein